MFDFKMGRTFEAQHVQCHRLDGSTFELESLCATVHPTVTNFSLQTF